MIPHDFLKKPLTPHFIYFIFILFLFYFYFIFISGFPFAFVCAFLEKKIWQCAGEH
jgi:hypothetical protein